MTLEQQVCSLELAKRLKELGVKQESVFSWRVPTGRDKTPKPLADEEIRLVYLWYEYQKELWDTYSAFTAAELGELLPVEFHDDDLEEFGLRIWKDYDGQWFVVYYDSKKDYRFIEFGTLANAMAQMLIYLIENNLLTLLKKEG